MSYDEYDAVIGVGESGETTETSGGIVWHLCPECGCNLDPSDNYSTCGCGWGPEIDDDE